MTEPDDPRPGDPQQGGPQPGDAQERPAQPEVGSVGEEAAKLFGALADLARQQGTGMGASLGGLVEHAGSMAKEVNDHLATDSVECRYCPVCRVVHAVRETSPEVRTHLLTAATSLLQAAAGLLETVPPPESEGSQRGPEVQRIGLDEGGEPLDPDGVW